MKREPRFRLGCEKELSSHVSYAGAFEIQSRGDTNNTPCSSCARNSGPFSNGCVSFEKRNDGKALFNGVCGNCFWGGQGRRCTYRTGGASVRTRKNVAIFVDRNRSNLHLGGDNNLASVDGIRDALAEIDGVRSALVARGKSIEAGKSVPDLGVEEVFNGFEEDDDDDEESWGGFEDEEMDG